MTINSYKYYIIDALKSLKRNATISLASAVTVTATMVILGVFILLMQNVNLGMSDLESKIQVQVFWVVTETNLVIVIIYTSSIFK